MKTETVELSRLEINDCWRMSVLRLPGFRPLLLLCLRNLPRQNSQSSLKGVTGGWGRVVISSPLVFSRGQ